MLSFKIINDRTAVYINGRHVGWLTRRNIKVEGVYRGN